MDTSATNKTVILLRDESGELVPYRIDEVLSITNTEMGISGDYTVLVRVVGANRSDPIIVRALDAEIPSFVGIEDEDELALVKSEYDAIVMRRQFRLV